MFNALLTSLVLLINTEAAPKANYSVNTDESKVVWKATKVTGSSHSGTVNIKTGSLKFSGKELSGGTFVIDMTSIANTDMEDGEWKDKLVAHLKNDDFFSVDKFPTATLTITDVKSKGNGSYTVTSDVTIKGQTNSVTFDAEVASSGKNATATAVITIDRSKFNVRYGSNSFFDNLGDKAINDDFVLSISLTSSK